METPKTKAAPAKDAQADAEQDDLREPTKEELMEDLRIALRDVMAGYEGQDAMESLEELRREIYGETDSR